MMVAAENTIVLLGVDGLSGCEMAGDVDRCGAFLAQTDAWLGIWNINETNMQRVDATRSTLLGTPMLEDIACLLPGIRHACG